jgi:membrane fusion protein (multidrug efflux system)
VIRKGTWIAVVASATALVGCSGAKAPAGPQGPTEVGVITLATRSVGIVDELPGRTVAYRVAEVRPQVSGIIQKRLFAEGSDVRVGEQLYQIDPSSYTAALRSAEARCSARRRIARGQAAPGPVRAAAREQPREPAGYDDAVTGFSAAEADVAAAKAQVESARINVVYCQVLSPIAGRIGRTLVTEGALVTSQQSTPLALVQQLDPIYVDITQSSVGMLKLQRALARGELQRDEKNEAEVSLTLEDGSEYAERGKLSSPRYRSIRARAPWCCARCSRIRSASSCLGCSCARSSLRR